MIATMGHAVDGSDGPLGTVAGTREAVGGRSMGYLLVRQSRLFGLAHTTRLVPITWVKAGTGDRVTLDASRAQVADCPPVRDDESIRVDVAQALTNARRPFRVGGLQVAVREGVVDISGHSPSERDADHAVAQARLVAGVLNVHDSSIDDEALVAAVAKALTRDAVTRKACLQVLSRLGVIDLAGELPTESARDTATALARAVPGVTRVHNGATLPFVGAAAAA
jgi:osmotically-inducible protein OsmY